MKLFPLNRRLFIRAVAILLVSLFAIVSQFPITQAAGTFTVNSLGDTPDALVGDGICADAGGVCTFRAALDEANANTDELDTINFSVTGTINLSGPLPVVDHVTIIGPGSSLLTVRRNTGGDYRILLIDSGNHLRPGPVFISGITVTNGKTPDGPASPGENGPEMDGGGIVSGGFSPVTLSDVVVTGNRTGNGGGGVNSTGGPGGNGGGMFVFGTLTLINVTISNNTTGNGNTGPFGGSGGRGAGIFTSATLTMTNCIVSGNTTGNGAAGTNEGASGGGGGDGGGVFVNGSSARINNSIITGNKTGDGNMGGSGGGGGGLIVMPRMSANLDGVTISNNATGNGGGGTTGQGGRGGGFANHGFANIDRSTFNGNTTGNAGASGGANGGHGGAISNFGSLRLANITVSGNSTGGSNAHGGGIYNGSNVSMSMASSTITGNASSSHVGNGFYQTSFSFTAPVSLKHTIVAQNVGGPDTVGAFNSTGGNLIGNADDSTGFLASDLVGTTAAPLNAMLGPLADNGGPTQTHALLAGSPALDAGNNSNVGSSTPTDQRGTARIADSDDAGTTATVDIGAYEFHQTLQTTPDQSINEDTSLSLAFALGDAGQEATSVTASSSNQALLPDANLVITGTGLVRNLQATPLASLSGTTTITITATYVGGSFTTKSFLLTVLSVNDAPTFTKGPDQIVNEDSGEITVTNWATAMSPGVGESGQTLTFLLAQITNSELYAVLPAVSSSGTLTFTPAPNAFGTSVVAFILQDDGGTENGGQNQSIFTSFSITVNSVNDAPTFTKGANQTVEEDSGGQNIPNWATNISVGPPNESQSTSFVVTNNTNPSLLTNVSVGGTGLLSFLPAPNANGLADITIVAKDSGGTANGGVDTSAPQTFRITVTPVNDAPSHNFPLLPSTNQQTPLVFSTANANAISVIDDSGTNVINTSLTVTNGRLTVGTKAGLNFSVGDGTDDATMTFSGSAGAINTALNGLTYKPNNGFSGTETFQITTNDNGHTGTGGAKSASSSFAIQVLSGGRFVFNTGTYGVNENGGTATITVLRGGGTAGDASVSVSTSGGSATPGASCTAGVDYLPASHTFTWGNGDFSPRQFVVTICNDSLVEGDETINLTLDSPTGTGSLGTQSTATLTIGTDDGPVLLFNPETQEAIALDLVNLTRDPFSLTNPFNMSADQRRRISLFVWQAAPLGSNEVPSVTATMRDAEFRVYDLQVEALSPVTTVPGVTQVVVKLPESIIGAPRDMFVKVVVKGFTTNEALIHITAP